MASFASLRFMLDHGPIGMVLFPATHFLVKCRNLKEQMEREAHVTRPPTDKLSWDFSAFVQYALKVIAIMDERKKAESAQKRALTPEYPIEPS
jgi:hypothetical protein